MKQAEQAEKDLLPRRKLVVDPQFQLGLMFRTVYCFGFYLFLLSAGLFAPLISGAQGPNGGPSEAYDAVTTFLYMHDHFWPVAIFSLVAIALLSVVFSHRVAGPLVRLKRSLRSVADGTLPAVLETRPRDFLQEEVTAVNKMVESLDERIGAIHDTSLELTQAIEKLREQCESHENSLDDQLRQSLETLAQGVGKLEEKVGYFHSERDSWADGRGKGGDSPASGNPGTSGKGELSLAER